MTFDARKAQKAPASGQQNALFALITLMVVCGAFFAVLSLPHKAAGHDSSRLTQVSVLETSMPDLPGEAAESYFIALGRVDPKAQEDLSRKIARAAKRDDEALTQLIMAHAEKVLRDHADELGQADTKHFDALLDMTFDVMAGLMIAIEDARVHPVQRGTLTRADEAALQGVVMSLMADPDVLPLMVSLRAGDDAKKTLNGVNVCNLGATAVTAAKTLPQETKGRLLAEAARQFRDNGTSAFRTGVGF